MHKRKKNMIWLSLFLVPVMLGVWAFVVELSMLKTTRYRINLENYPADAPNLRIALLTDIHTGSPFNGLAKLEKIVAKTNALKPDLILLGGDYVIQNLVLGSPVPIEEIAARLGGLKATHGVYAVLGNHDHWEGAARVETALEAHGIEMLDNRMHAVAGLQLIGIGDLHTKNHDIEKAFAGAAANQPALVLSHSPDVFPDIPFGLTMAGHTHGGQVKIPFAGRLIVPSKYGQKYALGHIKEDAKQLIVSVGLGTSILPVRFLTPPEIVFIDIIGQ